MISYMYTNIFPKRFARAVKYMQSYVVNCQTPYHRIELTKIEPTQWVYNFLYICLQITLNEVDHLVHVREKSVIELSLQTACAPSDRRRYRKKRNCEFKRDWTPLNSILVWWTSLTLLSVVSDSIFGVFMKPVQRRNFKGWSILRFYIHKAFNRKTDKPAERNDCVEDWHLTS